ncbi:MAG: pyridoxal phosphate-dependent aminotransferase [Gemmatimonadales bacterium]|nr:pyridoxal phosphate-dependent aminotransferase [Gemmatimonadales bacterium]MYG50263.1 pyridoxal phosphate-dependent aminotransferase [Gemmatimonadales bacterium]MYK00407.1 pyridoxal phosphate-dependent aminotransferase [Candidatus Palauibacter ramosifaciens]
MAGIPGFDIDGVARAAESDPGILRLENLDTDLRPPAAAVAATRTALESPAANSYLPFTGRADLRAAAARHVGRLAGRDYDPDRECVITAGGTEGLLNALLATVDPGDEVVVTDPTYAGMLQRVRLAGARPRLAPWRYEAGEGWRLDLDALAGCIGDRTRALFIMNPSMPSGGVLDANDWAVVAELCRRHDLRLLYNAAMERILYDGRPYLHPASLPGMRGRTLTVGSVSKEHRMIGWRTGWIVGPSAAMAAVAKVGIYNVVTGVGIGQPGALAALTAADEAEDVAAGVRRWERRRDAVLDALRDYPVRPAAGGWSLLVDTRPLGVTARELSGRLLARAAVAATPMDAWGGPDAEYQLRLVFSNEPVSRLQSLGARFARIA